MFERNVNGNAFWVDLKSNLRYNYTERRMTMIFKEKIKHLRKTNDMSQEELADKLGISRQAVSRWETGETLPDAAMLVRLSSVFDVSIDSLLKDELEIKTPEKLSVSPTESKGSFLCKITGTCFAVISSTALICLGVLSSVFPVYSKRFINSGEDELYKANIFTFLDKYNLEWLFTVLIVALIVGVLLISYNKLKQRKAGSIRMTL